MSAGVVRRCLLTVVIAGASLSPFHDGFYDFPSWGLLAFVLVALSIALLIGQLAAKSVRVPTLAWVGVASIVVLWLWARLSTGWAADRNAALIGSDRWLLYAAVLLGLVLLIRGRQVASFAVVASGVGVCVFGGYLLIRMCGSQGAQLLAFGGGRLNLPLGYGPAESAFLLIGTWPLIGYAEKMNGVRAGLALGAATVLVALAVLGQSRSAEFAAAGSAVLLLLLVPGRLGRLWALIVLGGAVALFSPPLLNVYRQYQHGGLAAVHMRPAALAALGAGVLAGTVWTTIGQFASLRRRVLENSSRAVTVVLGVIVLGVVLAFHARIGHLISTEWNAFSSNAGEQTAGSRFAMGGGNRHEYWRVALDELKAHPFTGVGADNYQAGWMQLRRVTEDITQPHSLEFQTLAELGLVGAAALLVFIVSVVVAIFRLGRRHRGLSPGARSSRSLAVGGGGMFLVWLLASSVDWIHLIPGPTMLALVGPAAVLVRYRGGDAPASAEPFLRRRDVILRVPAGALALGLGVVGVLAVANPLRAEQFQSGARRALAGGDVNGALRDVARAEAIDPRALDSYYIEAAAYARNDNYGSARAALLRAVALDPSAFDSWLLLGDIAVRHGALGAARSAYAHAVRLDPHETTFNGTIPSS